VQSGQTTLRASEFALLPRALKRTRAIAAKENCVHVVRIHTHTTQGRAGWDDNVT
jgi:hypothetical protein